MDSSYPEPDSTKNGKAKRKSDKKEKRSQRSTGSLKRSLKWLMDRGKKKERSESEDDAEETSFTTALETSGADLFGNSSSYERNGEYEEDSSVFEGGSLSRPDMKRQRPSTRSSSSSSSSSSDSEVEAGPFCGASRPKRSGEKKRKKEKKRKEEAAARNGRRENSKKRKAEMEFSSDEEEDYGKVVLQFPSGEGSSSNGAISPRSSTCREALEENLVDEDNDERLEDPDATDATVTVVKRSKKNGGTWPRQNANPTACSSVASTHPRRGRNSESNPPAAKSPVRNEAPSGSSGDVEVRVVHSSRGMSVSVLLPSSTPSGRSSSARDIRSNAPLPPSQTTTLQRRRRQSGNRRNSLPAATHHGVLGANNAVASASFPDVTEESTPTTTSPRKVPSRRASVIQIDDEDDGVEESGEESDEPLVEFERMCPERIVDSDDVEELTEESLNATTVLGDTPASPDAVTVINQIDDDARLARQLQEEFDREMATTMAQEMERQTVDRDFSVDRDLAGAGSFRYTGRDAEAVPGAPGPYYDLSTRRRNLSRALLNSSTHAGDVSRAPHALRRAGAIMPVDFLSLAPFENEDEDEQLDALFDEDSNDTNRMGFDAAIPSTSTAFTHRSPPPFEDSRNRRHSRALSRGPEGRASSSRRGAQPLGLSSRGQRSSSFAEEEDESREDEPMDVDSTGPLHENLNLDSSSQSTSQVAAGAPRRSRRLLRGLSGSSLLIPAGGGVSARGAENVRSSSSPLSSSLNDIVIPLNRVNPTNSRSGTPTSVDRGILSAARGILRGRLARANLTSSTPTLSTLGMSAASTTASRGSRPLATSRSPTGRATRLSQRTRGVSDSRVEQPSEEEEDGVEESTGSSVPCAACEAIQGRIQTYLEHVRNLQETPVEGYDANFERMRVTTQLMRQTNEAMREWRAHTSEASHHSLEERSHRLNTMSSIYRQISDIIQGAVRGLAPGTPLSSSRSRSRQTRRGSGGSNSRSLTAEAGPSTSSGTSRATGRRRYPVEFNLNRRPRTPGPVGFPMPRVFIGQFPGTAAAGLVSLANFDYESLLRLGDIMGEVAPRGLSQTQINRLPTQVFDGTKNASASSEEHEDRKQCHVCLTEYDDGEQLRILPCFHRFHSSCIDEWIKSNPTCPLCRVRVEFDD